VEVWQAIGNLSPGVAVGVVCLYLYNLMALKYLEERKEMIQALTGERKEWTDTLKLLNQQYVDLLKLAVEAMTVSKGENHALRGKLTEFMLSLDTKLHNINEILRSGSGRSRGGNSD
jgi:hypothetical protein